MAGQRPDDAEPANNPEGRIVDDKMAEAHERIARIESSTEGSERNVAQQPVVVDEREFEKSLKEMEAESRDLKARIEEERRRVDMPIDSALGDPDFEQRSADGRNDLPDRDEE